MIIDFVSSDEFYATIDSLFKDEDTAYLFYHSPWDEQSVKILEFIRSNFSDTKYKFYIVNTFECPDAFNYLKPSRIPCLYVITDIYKEQAIPAMIWRTLTLLEKKLKKAKVLHG